MAQVMQMLAKSRASLTMSSVMAVEQFTFKAVYDLYVRLPNDQKRAFWNAVADISTADLPFHIADNLTLPEKRRFVEMMFEELWWRVFPLVQQTARKLIREVERARLKESRDRKSDQKRFFAMCRSAV
jgi:hypothetical protein